MPLSRWPVWAAPDTSGAIYRLIAATAVVAGVVNGTFGVTVIALEAFLH
jgi:H+/Cl- antiporter ClcA